MGVRPGNQWDLMSRLNGRPILRSVIVAASGTPKDNLSASGGVSIAYTLKGGEVLLLQGDVDFYYQVINDATTAMTASGAKAVLVSGGAPGERVILFGDDVRVCIDSPSGTATVKVFELR